MRPGRLGTLGYPVGGEGRERPLVACWVLVMVGSVLWVLAVVAFVPLVGYLVAVVGASVRDESAPPVGTDLGGLLGRGLGATAVVVGFLLVPGLALLVTVYGAIWGVGGSTLAGGERVLLYGGSTVVLSLFLVALYVLPVGLAVYDETGSVRAAFDTDRLGPVAGHAAYFSRWAAGSVTLSTAGAFGNVALQIHRAGPVVASLFVAYGTLLAAHVWGRGVRLARRR